MLTVLTGLWGLHGDQVRIYNYLRFAYELPRGVRLVTVELAYDDEPHCVTNPAMNDHLQLRAPRLTHCLFLKEALCNAGLPLVKTDAVAWIDADVLLLRDDWPEQLLKELERNVVAQPFSEAWYVDADGELAHKTKSAAFFWSTRNILIDEFSMSHPGLAWGARTEFLHRFPLYDRMPSGSNDTVMLKAFTDTTSLRHAASMSHAWRKDADRYVDSVADVIAGRIGFVMGAALHLNHGPLGKRGYAARWELPWFDPTTDLSRDDRGIPSWSESALRDKGDKLSTFSEKYRS